MTKKSNHPQREDDETDKLDTVSAVLEGSTLCLEMLEKVVSVAPVPGLQAVAQLAVSVVKIGSFLNDAIRICTWLVVWQGVRENKIGFQKTIDQCTEIIATIWTAYDLAPDKENWPPNAIRSALEGLQEWVICIGMSSPRRPHTITQDFTVYTRYAGEGTMQESLQANYIQPSRSREDQGNEWPVGDSPENFDCEFSSLDVCILTAYIFW